MYKLDKNFIKKIILRLTALSILFILGFCVYIFTVINELKYKLEDLNLYSKVNSFDAVQLESGSFVKKEQLKKFFLLNQENVNFDEWIQEQLKNKNIEIESKKVAILNDIQLPQIQKNSCKRLNCLQYKIEFSQLPAALWKGLLGIEDFRFLEHQGVDPLSILRAIIVDIKAMKLVQGGSTLTQQLVKNLFLTNDKKFERKLREVIYAIYLEKNLTKEEIINAYFNEVFWGVHQGIYLKGIGAASIAYFGKAPKELSEYESSILISLLKGPYFYHPINQFERLKKRVSVVHQRLLNVNLLDPSLGQWSDLEWSVWRDKINVNNNKSFLKSFYLLNDEPSNFWNSYEKFVYYESVVFVKNLLKKRFEGDDVAIKSFVVSKKCLTLPCHHSFSFYSKIQRSKEEAIHTEKHQVGSVLKPIIYEQFIKLGKNLTDQVETSPVTLKLISGNWTPKDASKVEEKKITLLKALQKSKNIPLIRTAQEVGFDQLERELKEYFPTLLLPLSEYPAQLLGAIELSLSDLAMAYSKYISQSCKNIKNEVYPFEQSILYYLSDAKNTTISRVANNTIKDLNIFGKTGTTNNGLDNWYIAYDGEQIYITWFGIESKRDKKVNLSGALSSFRIFQDFILHRGKRISEIICL